MKNIDGLVEINLGVFLDFPVLSESDSPTDNLYGKCFCENCLTGAGDQLKPDTSTLAELEALLKYFSILPPHRWQ